MYNKGNMVRDFTYIKDLVKAVYLLTFKIPLEPEQRIKNIKNDSISDTAPFRIVNIANSQPIGLVDFIKQLENILGKVAHKNLLEMQDGDIYKTHSDIELLKELIGPFQRTTLREGIFEFVKWFQDYYK